MTVEKRRQPRLFKQTYPPTPDGFRQKKKISDSSWAKWRPTMARMEEPRLSHLDGAPWREIDPVDLAEGMWQILESECAGRNGQAPSSNTLRGRYDAMSAFYNFLVEIGELTENPLPSSDVNRPSHQPKD